MQIKRNKITRFAACAVVAAVAVVPLTGTASASAKTVKFSLKTTGGPVKSLDDISGPISSKPFGKGKETGYVKIPKTFYTWTFKDCKLVATGAGALVGSKVPKGNWKITKGKSKGKKCKGATGKGTFYGDVATGKFFFKGTLKI